MSRGAGRDYDREVKGEGGFKGKERFMWLNVLERLSRVIWI